MDDAHIDETRHIVCRDCATAFPWTTGEQQFYAAHNFPEPKRCVDCRAARKAAQLPPWGRS